MLTRCNFIELADSILLLGHIFVDTLTFHNTLRDHLSLQEINIGDFYRSWGFHAKIKLDKRKTITKKLSIFFDFLVGLKILLFINITSKKFILSFCTLTVSEICRLRCITHIVIIDWLIDYKKKYFFESQITRS